MLSQALGEAAGQLAAVEKRRLLSRLLARLAHEVRNPLSSLDIHVQLLQEDLTQLEPAVRERVAGRIDIVRGELKRLEEIVEDFLRLAGPSSLSLAPVDPAALCEHLRALVGPEAEARLVDLQWFVEPGLPALQADGRQLTQAVLNLVINALQAVEHHGRVEVRVHREPGEFISFEVGDTGPGVPEENRAAIYDPIFTTKSDGTGLGLWIAQQIVQAHGGRIQVGRAELGGALFRIRLPTAQEAASHG